jgi:type VI secretion system secreted protein VgrG
MKTNLLLTVVQYDAKRIHMGLVLAVAIFLHHNATAVPVTVDLGTAGNFAILAGSAITDAGGASTIVTGNVGLSPATGAAIGLTAGQVGGTIYAVDALGPGSSVQNAGLLTAAKNNLTTAYNDAAGRSADMAFGVVDNQLGGQTLFPGVYSFGHAATANLIGNLTLDANGEANPVWIFQATSDFITASGSSVTVIGATSCDVFWQVSSSATIGTYTDFVGNIMADQSIALQTGATLDGSAQARIAAVTLDHNTITKSPCTGVTTVPDGGSTLFLLGSGTGTLLVFRRRLYSPAAAPSTASRSC